MLNKTSFTAFLTALLLGTGCVIVNPQDRRDPGDVTFAWSFNGETCAQSPEVAQVRITIPGELLENDGYYGCSNGGYEGITLHDFIGGSYTYTVEALSNTGTVLYEADGTFVIDGNVLEYVDLLPEGGPTSYVYLSWKFKANWASAAPDCTQAEIDYVDVVFDDDETTTERYTCGDGFGSGTARSILVPAGTHKVSLYAVNGTSYDVAEVHANITTKAYEPADHSFTLDWIIGGAPISWTLMDAGVAKSCAQAGVTKVFVNFKKLGAIADDDTWVYGTDLEYACNTEKVLFNHLRPGTYAIFVEATGTASSYYVSPAPRTSTSNEVVVTAGVFTDRLSVKNVPVVRQ